MESLYLNDIGVQVPQKSWEALLSFLALKKKGSAVATAWQEQLHQHHICIVLLGTLAQGWTSTESYRQKAELLRCWRCATTWAPGLGQHTFDSLSSPGISHLLCRMRKQEEEVGPPLLFSFCIKKALCATKTSSSSQAELNINRKYIFFKFWELAIM